MSSERKIETDRKRRRERNEEGEREMKTKSELCERAVPDTDITLLGKQILKKQDVGEGLRGT